MRAAQTDDPAIGVRSLPEPDEHGKLTRHLTLKLGAFTTIPLSRTELESFSHATLLRLKAAVDACGQTRTDQERETIRVIASGVAGRGNEQLTLDQLNYLPELLSACELPADALRLVRALDHYRKSGWLPEIDPAEYDGRALSLLVSTERIREKVHAEPYISDLPDHPGYPLVRSPGISLNEKIITLRYEWLVRLMLDRHEDINLITDTICERGAADPEVLRAVLDSDTAAVSGGIL